MSTTNNLTIEQLTAQLEQMRLENEALKAGVKVARPSLKVSAKGAVTLFGVTRPQFAPTFYASQWLAILDKADEIRAFIIANNEKLSVKPVKVDSKKVA